MIGIFYNYCKIAGNLLKSLTMKENLLIYYVDNDQDDLDFLAEVAEEAGHKIVTFTSGQEMLTMLDYTYPAPDVIFIDYMMPEMSGAEVLIMLKSNSVLQHIPSIMVTGSCSIYEVDVFLKAGANHIVEKAKSKAEFQEIFHHVAQIDWETYCPALKDFVYL